MPVFIGNFRSGSTLLVNLLGLHPKVSPWFETKALCEPLRWLRVLNHPETLQEESRRVRPSIIPGFSTETVAARMRADFEETTQRIQGLRDSGKGHHERYPIGADYRLSKLEECLARVNQWQEALGHSPSPSAIENATGELIRALGDLETQRSGATLWINKTPEIPRFGSELRSCLGPCKIILLIRDGREVVRSAAKLGWASEPELAHWWKHMILESRSHSQDAREDYLEVRYEDLLENPATTLKVLLKFLQLEGDAESLITGYNSRIGEGGKRLTEGPREPRPESKKLLNSNTEVTGMDLGFLRSLGYLTIED